MALARNLADLPRPARDAGGNPPDPTGRWARVLADALTRTDRAKAHATPGSRWRHSDAAACARRLGLQAAGIAPTDPFDVAGLHVMGIGTALHERWQAALYLATRDRTDVDVTLEARCHLRETDSSGHIDALINLDGRRVVVEVKTIGGFGYKLAVGDRGPAQGPRHSAIVQGALNAWAVDADDLVIVLIATEAISKPQAARKGIDDIGRFCSEWTYPQEIWEPIARAEAARLQAISAQIDAGDLPARRIPDPDIPDDAIITDPTKGTWVLHDAQGDPVDVGSTWQCGYCPMQTACTTVGPSPISVTDALTRLVAAGLTKAGEAA